MESQMQQHGVATIMPAQTPMVTLHIKLKEMTNAATWSDYWVDLGVGTVSKVHPDPPHPRPWGWGQ